ncbi:MAG TPA: hypothetical protein VG365_16525 [Solirubrobacteraceae bacterium]|jgi:hypothetical protein|nr:hypothetical protein [Solirubrobacteraceae bacterium]
MLHPPAPVNYKTVRLAAGKHDGPADGVCVMELASMIAGEPFTDHPRSVCPVVASFLRGYNDAIDDGRRQDLYRFASMAVGTRESWRIEQLRAQRCREWAAEMWQARPWPLRLFRRVDVISGVEVQAAARSAIAAIGRHTDLTHAKALELVDELCSLTAETPPSEAPDLPAGASLSPQAA